MTKIKKIWSGKLKIFSYPSVLTFVVGAQKNCLHETVLLSTHNMFWLRDKKIIIEYALLYRGLIIVICEK